MTKLKPWWFLSDWQAWALLGLGLAVAVITQQWWAGLLGIIGYLLILVFDLLGGASLDRNAVVRLAHAEQENRTLQAEQAQLAGGIQELQDRLADLTSQNEQLAAELRVARSETERMKTVN